LRYKTANYVVTAKHVIENSRDPMIGYHKVDRTLQRTSADDLGKIAHLDWKFHPDKDIAVIPFPIQDYMDVSVIPENNWNIPINTNKENEVMHLGYPQGIGASYANGTLAFFPIAMSGSILESNSDIILTQTNGQQGASGGPLFLRKNQTPQLIGIVYEAVLSNGTYQNKTKSIPIYHIKEILDSDEITKQVNEYEKLVKDSNF